jgi:hypothetical protein
VIIASTEVTVKQKRKSQRQWQELMVAWDKSGEAAEVFAARHGVRAKTLVWWRSELRRRGASRGAALVPVKVVSAREPSSVVELVLGSATLRFESGAAPRHIALVTRAVLEELRG